MDDRLTWRTSVGTANFAMIEGVRKDNIARSAFYQRACERLADYEDTGLLPSEVVAMREELKGLRSRWEETASDGTGYTLSHLDGIYALADEHGAVLCEFIRDTPSSPVAAIPATANRVLTLQEVLALPEGARVWVEERYGGGRGGEHFRAKKDGDADVLRRADNPDNGCWLKEPFFGDYWRVWSLPVAPTEEELRGNPWTKEGE